MAGCGWPWLVAGLGTVRLTTGHSATLRFLPLASSEGGRRPTSTWPLVLQDLQRARLCCVADLALAVPRSHPALPLTDGQQR